MVDVAVKVELLAVRDYVDADKDFIFSTWLRGLKYGNSWFKAIDPVSYFRNYQRVLEQVMDSPKTNIKIACLKEDPEVILGYAVFSGEHVLHWVQVKAAWRNIGIAKMLVSREIKRVTHLTKAGQAIMANKLPEAVFDPFLIP